MQNIAIFPVINEQGAQSFRAVAQSAQSEGRTPGEALDAVTPSLPADSSGTVVVIQSFLPDELFTQEQRSRLEQLMTEWRTARDAGRTLSRVEEAELQSLMEAELSAARRRAAQALQGLTP